MSSYPKNCKFCGQEIQMSDESGRWLPYNKHNGSFHECQKTGEQQQEQQQQQSPTAVEA